MLVRSLALLLSAAAAPAPAGADQILGSGSTFAHPLVAAWSDGLLRERGGEMGDVSIDSGVDYEAVGSVAGMMRLRQADVDFAATDAPLTPEALAERDLAQFPLAVGGIALVANLPDGVEGPVAMPGEVMAEVLLGRVASWSDPALAAVNPGLSLPDLPIAVVARADGSGSTLALTRWLAAESADWAAGPGAATSVAWAVGEAVDGSTRVLEAVAATEGAIGYVEYGQAARSGLDLVAISSGGGDPVLPSPEAFAATASGAAWLAEEGFVLDLAAIEAPGAYPLTTATYALMRRGDGAVRTRRTLYFFRYGLERGQGLARDLGYVPLPGEAVAAVAASWRDLLPGAEGM